MDHFNPKLTVRIAGFADDSIVDGEGLRFAVFFQGCPHNCEGCHNPKTHDFSGGFEISIREICAKIDANPLIDGITITGGEPFCQPDAVRALAAYAQSQGLNVWAYTGYKYEEMDQNLLENIDVLVDGKFEKEHKTLNIPFVGSSNQRIIRVRYLPQNDH